MSQENTTALNLSRRRLLAAALSAPLISAAQGMDASTALRSRWKISLAQWSLHRTFFRDGVDPATFATIARREFGLSGVEYVNQFYFDTLTPGLIRELKQRADDEGVTSLLIMCDNEGRLGDPDTRAREDAVRNHYRWADAAHELGCHSLRVNAASEGSYAEQRRLAADGLHSLAEYCEPLGLNVLVENHGGLSSNGRWLADVIQAADHDCVGTLPDFGNFVVDRETGLRYDKYQGVEELLPFAKAVSAKAYDFNMQGNEPSIDFFRMIRLLDAAQYDGWIGIEWEGDRVDEYDGIRKTQALLVKAMSQLESPA